MALATTTSTAKPIPSNIITGFLGVGKTTAILHLLRHKPAHENWAVLVNEFGEVGIDGAILRQSGAYVREVPGGCMCCVMGLPMQVGLRRLISESRPDRLLIEPTGLGHPLKVIEVLENEFGGLLDLRATLTLIDPRHLDSPRHLENGNFQDQIALADVLVANKIDLSSPAQIERFRQYASEQPRNPSLGFVAHGELQNQWLNEPRRGTHSHLHHAHQHAQKPADIFTTVETPGSPAETVRRENAGEGFYSCGWVFHPVVIFDFERLFAWLSGLDVDRMKAVMITNQGVFVFNLESGVLKVLELDEASDSRVELIHSAPRSWEMLETQLIALVRVKRE